MSHVEAITEHGYNLRAIEEVKVHFDQIVGALHAYIQDIENVQHGLRFKQTGILIDASSLKELHRFELSWCGHKVMAYVKASTRGPSGELCHTEVFTRIDFWWEPTSSKEARKILSLEVAQNGMTNLHVNNGPTRLGSVTLGFLFVEIFSRVLKLNQT